jgi:hypothetical protein
VVAGGDCGVDGTDKEGVRWERSMADSERDAAEARVPCKDAKELQRIVDEGSPWSSSMQRGSR